MTDVFNGIEDALKEQLAGIDEALKQIDKQIADLREQQKSRRNDRRRVEQMLRLAKGEKEKPKEKPKRKAGAPSQESIDKVLVLFEAGDDDSEYTIRQIVESTELSTETVRRVIEFLMRGKQIEHGDLRVPDDSGGHKPAQHYRLKPLPEKQVRPWH